MSQTSSDKKVKPAKSYTVALLRCQNPARTIITITDIFVVNVIVIIIEQYLLFNSLTFFYHNCFIRFS